MERRKKCKMQIKTILTYLGEFFFSKNENIFQENISSIRPPVSCSFCPTALITYISVWHEEMLNNIH